MIALLIQTPPISPPPPPPGLQIDTGILTLTIIAILYGVFTIVNAKNYFLKNH
ncbi:hypothetical protein [Polaribacter sp. 11A2H]|uniref:hypothetical protein n=1 Tax=Polaribacter sp. 11A2H TaxID=2687290 RepID=UPI00140B88E2|nr:hypothetical protein [Polaribacter sp. 11A2H]